MHPGLHRFSRLLPFPEAFEVVQMIGWEVGQVDTDGLGLCLDRLTFGQILPGDIDRFAFRARKGDRLVVVAAARRLIPHLADAVPGWFQATMALYDANGNELAYADDYQFDPDPALYYEIPEEATYVIEIRDAIHRGREDFVYRITLGEIPFVTSIFPLGGPAGARTPVEVSGWNLPRERVVPGSVGGEPGSRPISLRKGAVRGDQPSPPKAAVLSMSVMKPPSVASEPAARAR